MTRQDWIKILSYLNVIFWVAVGVRLLPTEWLTAISQSSLLTKVVATLVIIILGYHLLYRVAIKLDRIWLNYTGATKY